MLPSASEGNLALAETRSRAPGTVGTCRDRAIAADLAKLAYCCDVPVLSHRMPYSVVSYLVTSCGFSKRKALGYQVNGVLGSPRTRLHHERRHMII